ncbi:MULTISPECIES: aspartate/glutamate racemase family protein [Arthrobacter]|uniref:Aspartate/glutamate racemase family protein n=1 Tax=Arthrobacter terricola TaxID=2547396 RepID=A0A4R5KIL3_9MICC|nr:MULTISPECIES: aspartate/glutamate racemase family protein [Arthrobacter]MBT8161998.1 aspartate/glutamate racemase family protein [Arthrobacter sp. GN70]TDF94608.1 aspartate/glutamate racemase family protein [Arthrobacter terricola]
MGPLLLINPNTSKPTTIEMVDVARAAATNHEAIIGATALRGSDLIDDDGKLATAAEAVVELAQSLELAPYQGIIVSAFGDPGVEELRRRVPVPVTGIAEAGIFEAAREGRRFSIVTTTPRLASAINGRVAEYGFGDLYTGLRLTEGNPAEIMKDAVLLEESLSQACEIALVEDAAEAIVIGGGPLALSAVALRRRFPVPIIEPVPAAVRLALARAARHESLMI